uniref:Uncharacterized protein n=1 Tax=Kalanchoe fedtschenkoi TaxID=63787 RepID=A0A7N0UHA8_KALFE
MEKGTDLFPGMRKTNLKSSFKLSVHSLLTSCSKEEFLAAFSRFSSAEQTQLHRLFIQVITTLHENIEDEFESFCLETQVDDTLDAVEQLIEERNMDPLFSVQSNLRHIGEDLVGKMKNEIQYLKKLLEKAEEQKSIIKARVEQLREETSRPSNMA